MTTHIDNSSWNNTAADLQALRQARLLRFVVTQYSGPLFGLCRLPWGMALVSVIAILGLAYPRSSRTARDVIPSLIPLLFMAAGLATLRIQSFYRRRYGYVSIGGWAGLQRRLSARWAAGLNGTRRQRLLFRVAPWAYLAMLVGRQLGLVSETAESTLFLLLVVFYLVDRYRRSEGLLLYAAVTAVLVALFALWPFLPDQRYPPSLFLIDLGIIFTVYLIVGPIWDHILLTRVLHPISSDENEGDAAWEPSDPGIAERRLPVAGDHR